MNTRFKETGGYLNKIKARLVITNLQGLSQNVNPINNCHSDDPFRRTEVADILAVEKKLQERYPEFGDTQSPWWSKMIQWVSTKMGS